MATFLDVSLLRGFAGIFTFILVWVIAFGALEMASPFGKGKSGLNGIVAIIAAFFVFFTGPVRQTLEFVIPWLMLMAIIIFFALFIFMVMGAKMGTFKALIGQDSILQNWIIILVVVVLLIGLGGALGGSGGGSVGDSIEYQDAEQTPNPFLENIVKIVRNPKFLGLIFLLLLGTFTIIYMAKYT